MMNWFYENTTTGAKTQDFSEALNWYNNCAMVQLWQYSAKDNDYYCIAELLYN